MSHMTVLAGGGGSVKFLVGLADVLPEEEIHIVANVADDYELWGLRISPDVDRILYALAGELDPRRGWNRPNETFNCHDTIRKLSMPSQQPIGDSELATHLVRSSLLAGGASLETVTAQLADRFGIGAQIMPASNDRIRIQVHHLNGTWSLQEYLAQDEQSNLATGVSYAGADTAGAPEHVVESILGASRVILAPSDPVLSIGAILSVPGIRDAVSRTDAGIIAISPVIGSQPVSGGAGQLMKVSGSSEVSARSVAERYGDFLDAIVIHTADVGMLDRVREIGLEVWVENILLNSADDAVRLARRVTNLERALSHRRSPRPRP